MQQNDINLKIDEGTVSFWIKENKISFNDGKAIPIFSIEPLGGDISILKDTDNKIKVFYRVAGKEQIDVTFDVSTVDPTAKHMVAFTWSLDKKEIKLYFDGEVVARKTIKF